MTLPFIAQGLALLALARLVLAPLGDFLTRRHAAADPWSPECEQPTPAP